MDPDDVTALSAGAGIATQRATVCLWAGSIEEKVEFTTWLSTWRKKMTFVSRDYGCSCCIHLFDIEGPPEAIDALPEVLLTVSAWAETGVKSARRYVSP